MTAATKRVIDYNIAEPATKALAASVPLTFRKDSKGSVCSTYGGNAVYIDRDAAIPVNAGDTFFVTLKDKTIESGCWFATPIRKVDADFFMEQCVKDRNAFLESVLLRGGKVSDELIDILTRCSPDINEKLTRGEGLMCANQDLQSSVLMYKSKLENANATIRKKDAEIDKLKAQLSKKSAEKSDSSAAKKLDAMKAKVAELENANAVLKADLEYMTSERNELENAIAEMASCKQGLLQDVARVSEEIARKDSEMKNLQEELASKEDALAEMDEKDRLIDALSAQVSSLRKSGSHPEQRVSPYATVFRPGITIRRDSEGTISSDWFTAPRYKVLVSGDLARMRIYPSEDGDIECAGYALKMPRLEEIAPFSGQEYLQSDFDADMSAVEVRL